MLIQRHHAKNRALRSLLGICVTLILVAQASYLSAQTKSGTKPNPDLALINQLLVAVQPGQKTVLIDDMEFPVSLLQAYRDHLAGSTDVHPQSSFSGTVPTWTGGVIPYTFDAAVTATHQLMFRDAASEWETFANVTFVPRTTQTNYVIVQNCACAGGQATVGMIGGSQTLSIGSWNRGTLVHEIGHTLGMVHEHQRSDRDTFVTILTNNITAGSEHNFTILPSSVNQGAYDFLSVMHYPRNAFSVNPATLDTIEPKAGFTQFINIMGQQRDPVLSSLDRSGMALVYGAGPVLTNIVTNTKDSGPGSWRAAMYYAFDHPGSTVTFNIPTNDPGFNGVVYTIQFSDVLPELLNATTVDGSTQPGNSNPNGPEILLSGTGLEPFAYGPTFRSTNCTLRGFIINGFDAAGVLFTGTNSIGNSVQGCYIGTDPSGTSAVSNGWSGVRIELGARSNVVGGTTASARNIISGNGNQGVAITDSGTMFNSVIGNYIGLNPAGTAPLGNTWSGVNIINGAQSNFVGGVTTNARNVISGNLIQGVAISGTNTGFNVVQGNYIGLNAAGTTAISNTTVGVNIFSGSFSNVVGAGNVISGNGNQGIAISGSGTVGNLVQGNLIGLNPAGTAAIGNNGSGVSVFSGAKSNTIGGTNVPARNVVSGNLAQGVVVSGAGTMFNTVLGNYVGLNIAGSAAVSNSFAGVQVTSGAQSNTVGGAVAGAGNVISGNGNQGVLLSSAGTSSNMVQGNIIGLNAAGTARIANQFSGVGLFSGAQVNLIGGTNVPARNIISGNAIQGVVIVNAGTINNAILGNYIGLNVAGNAAVSNTASGIEITTGAQSNQVGAAGAGNVISGNGAYGINLNGTASFNRFQGNTIGLSAVSTNAIPNNFVAVVLFSGPTFNLIGGTNAGQGNIVSASTGDGIQVFDTATTANTIRGNSIFANTGLGINLFGGTQNGFGVTSNDACDGDTGPNNLQNFPVLNSAVSFNGIVTIAGTLNSTASTIHTLDFLANASCDASGAGEGTIWLGSAAVTTSAGCTTNFTVAFVAAVSAGQSITAMATDPSGNSSEFSACITVTAPCLTLSPSTLPDGVTNVVYNQTITASGGPAPITFSLTSGSLPNGLSLSSGGIISGTPTTVGTFNFVVTAANTNNCVGSGPYTINVTSDGGAPVASFTGSPTNGTAPLAVTFTDTSTGTITNRNWSFGDGGISNTVSTSVAYTYLAAGTNTVRLIVSGPSGVSTNTRVNYITVAGVPPQLFVSPSSRNFGTIAVGQTNVQPFSVINTGGSSLAGTASVAGPFSISGGSPFNVGSGQTGMVNVSFIPATNGNFSNNVIFASNGGGSTNLVTGIGAIVPVASFTGSPTNGKAPLAVTFTDTSIGTITNRLWNFGDGGVTNTTATSVPYTYLTAGTNTVTLIAQGPVGASTNTKPAYVAVVVYPPGDVNGDLRVTGSDALLINQVIVNLRSNTSAVFAAAGYANGDVNQSGTVTGGDPLLINQVIVGLRAHIVTKILPSTRNSTNTPTAVTIYGLGFPTNVAATATIGAPVSLTLSNVVVVNREQITAIVPAGGGSGTGTVSVVSSPTNGVTSFGRFINP